MNTETVAQVSATQALAAATEFMRLKTSGALAKMLTNELKAASALIGHHHGVHRLPPRFEVRVKNAVHSTIDYMNARWPNEPLPALLVEVLRVTVTSVEVTDPDDTVYARGELVEIAAPNEMLGFKIGDRVVPLGSGEVVVMSAEQIANYQEGH